MAGSSARNVTCHQPPNTTPLAVGIYLVRGKRAIARRFGDDVMTVSVDENTASKDDIHTPSHNGTMGMYGPRCPCLSQSVPIAVTLAPAPWLGKSQGGGGGVGRNRYDAINVRSI